MTDVPADEPQEPEPEAEPEPAAEPEAENVNGEVIDSPTVNAHVVGVEIVEEPETAPEG